MKFMFLLTLSFLTFTTLAQESSTTAPANGTTPPINVATSEASVKSYWDQLKDSPASLRLLLDNYTIRNSASDLNPEEISGSSTDIYPLFTYDITPVDQFRIEALASFFNGSAAESNRKQFLEQLAEVRYTRKNILTEAQIGFDVSAYLRGRYYLDVATRDAAGYDGYATLGFPVGKALTDKLYFTSGAYFYQYLRTTGAESTRSQTVRVDLGLSYQLSDKWGTGFWSGLYNNRTKEGVWENKYRFVPSVSYAASRDVSLELYADLYPIKSNDGEVIRRGLEDETTYGVLMSFKAF